MTSRTPWEDEASNWVRWVRTPDNDVFSYYAPSFFDEIVPPPRGLTLEIGCGEGRVARQLVSRAHDVIALDASTTLARFARDADARSAYLLADATTLPFADATFQTVVAYNSLQTMTEMTDMAHAVREAARVLTPSGRFCLCVAHPMTDVGRLKKPAADEDLIFSGSYFDRQHVDEAVTKDGLEMTFHGWTYTLEDYIRALEEAGFLIERVREPVPGAEQAIARPTLQRWRRLPLFLSVRAVKPAR
ncbi:MAG TPA: class I SAM-dependent methyltransferase [Dehalococcoidia bacterium]|nr:class I SAM-dependent methyltransferase [Dehalococcoidia bacterium]